MVSKFRSKWALFALFCSAGFGLANAEAQVPRGVFSLFGAGQHANEIVLANPDVVGVTIRQDWAELEPTEGNFDFTFLDSEIARVAAAGKQILLRIHTQSAKPAWVTAAIVKAGGQFYTFDDNGVLATIPVFWDPTFLAKKQAMIAAVGAHTSADPALKVVVASFANATSEDWNVPHTPSEILDLLAVGYTTEKMLDAGKQIIDTTMTAFPNQLVTMAIGGNGHFGNQANLDPTATYLAENVIATARASWPGRMIAQINSLSTFNPVAPGTDDSAWNLLWKSQPDVAAQMLYWCSEDPTYRVNGGVPGDPATVLTKSIDAGLTYGLSYIEVYQRDVLNLPAVISYAHDLLATPSSLLNVSTRLEVGVGDEAAISGFIVNGTGPKKVLVRAIGPSLEQFGISSPLSDPVLELHDAAGAILATNDNWGATQKAEIQASGLAPGEVAEAALIAELTPGAYTAIVRGAGAQTGVGLAEIYDLDEAAPAIVGNLSTRGSVQTDVNVMIGGFIIGGTGTAEVVVRALGPSLAAAGLAGTLADPTLDLRNSEGLLVAANDNWTETQQAEIQASGLAPGDAREAAIRQTLGAGSYTATVAGRNGGNGIGLVEVYRLP